jgi:outer membrane receptor protein involved in Fe transport
MTVAAAVALVLSGRAVPVWSADDTAKKDEGALEEILVTAQRREQSVLDVPYNISAVSGKDIEARQIADAPELLRSVPGVAIVDRGYRNSGVITGVSIRGLNIDSSALGDYAVSTVPTVSAYVNDTPLYANFLLRDLERVEVLRGPQGTLYGSGSLGGTIRYITRAPQLGKFEGNVRVNGSQVDGSSGVGFSGDGTINLPVGETAALRVNVSRLKYPGLTDYANVYVLDANGIPVAPNGLADPAASYRRVKDADTVDIWYGRAALRLKPSDAVDLTLSYTRQSDDIGGRRQETVGLDGFGRQYQKYENGSIQLEPSSRDVDLTALEATFDLGFATLTSSSSYYDHTGDSTSENTGFYAKAGFLAFYYNYPRPMASAVRTYGDKAFVEEVRLASKGNNTFDYVVGLYYENQKLKGTQDSFLRGFKNYWDAVICGGPGACADAVTGDQDFAYARNEKYEDKAFFGELTWHATDKLDFTGGVRYFDYTSDNNTFQDLPLYAGFSDPSNAQFKTSDSKALFKGNVAWKFAERDMLFATISEGYRRGGSNAVPLTGTFAESPLWQLYEPDQVTNFEVGIKGARNRFQYSASLFYVDWDKIQLNTATINWGFFAVINAGKAKTSGVEVELEGQLSDNWHASLGLTYVDAKLSEDAFLPTDPNHTTPFAFDGDQLPGTAKQSVNLGLDYTQHFGSGTTWYNRIDGYYQSGTRNAIGASLRFNVPIDGFSIWNLSSTLNFGTWDATLFLKNIFNEEGTTGLFTEAYMGTDPAVGYYGNGSKNFIALPRTVGVSLAYRF